MKKVQRGKSTTRNECNTKKVLVKNNAKRKMCNTEKFHTESLQHKKVQYEKK